MPDVADPMPASLAAELARQYDIVRLLGRGGMGAVWLARERSLDRLVAIKVLSGDAIGSADLRERFRREARIAARLVHPNIVPLHSFGETPDALYFVMGFVEGETLASRLERDGRLSRQVALRILGEIGDALAFAHREGVVHRDVKPENILLEAKAGRAMLADFGVARVEGGGASVTMTGMAVGTPSYMSPEQAVGDKAIDGRSDIYSLGVVGYRMLAGRLPFTAGSLQALLAQHAVAKPDDLALAVAPGDRGIAEALMRALEKEPAARWARAEDLRDELLSAARHGVALPEELERVQTVGIKLFGASLGVAALFNFALYDPIMSGGLSGLAAAGFIAGSFSVFPLIGLAYAFPTARTLGWRETLRAMFNPPAGWSSWWPRSLRRPDDIWDRLPAPLRRVRNIIAGVATWIVWDLLFLPLAITSGLADVISGFTRSIGLNDGIVFGGPKLLAFAWIAIEVIRARKKLGMTTRDFGQVLALPNVSSHAGWSKPKFARLLALESGDAPTLRAPQTPEEIASAIAQLSDRLRKGGLLPDDESARAAQAVRSAIDGLEAEVQRLHRELDPAEAARLDRRLAALGQSDDDAELRKLLESQRAVTQRLEQKRQEKEGRRDRLRDQLVTLWMQLVELDARAARGAQADPELTGQVRALSSDLARVGSALGEVETLLTPGDRSRDPR